MVADLLPHNYDRDAVLIDTGSTCSVFRNKNYLNNVRASSQTLHAFTNGGHQDSRLIGTLSRFYNVWYNPASMLNILAWRDVKRHFRITTDMAVDDTIYVPINDDEVYEFREVGAGLYMAASNYFKSKVHAYSCLTLVSNNRLNYSTRELLLADKACDLYIHLGMPSQAHFKSLINTNYFRNCPVTPADVDRAVAIYGRLEPSVQGRTTCGPPIAHTTHQVTMLPPAILSNHSSITISVDYFFVNRIPFLHSILQDYLFRTAEPLKSKAKANKHDMLKGLKSIINLYRACGIAVTQINADMEFACVRDDLRPVFLNIAASDAHIGDIERSIRTVKEDTRTLTSLLPFPKFPRELIIGAVVSAIRSRNQLPAPRGISKTLSPATLVTGEPSPDYHTISKLKYGDFVHTYEGTSNDNNPRTIPTIALYPSNNSSGSWYFMSLTTVYLIHRQQYTKLPAPEDIIDRVNKLADAQKGNALTAGIQCEWSPGHPILDLEPMLHEPNLQINNGTHTPPQPLPLL